TWSNSSSRESSPRWESRSTRPAGVAARAEASVRLGLVSDTHGLLRPEVFEAFEGVDRILHAGDVGDEEILVELEAIAPVTAVWGNVDGFALRQRLPEVARLDLEGVAVAIVHGQQFGSPTPAAVARAHPDAALVVFGHSHEPVIERVGQVLAVNPGSAGPARFGLPVAVAIATILDRKVSAERVELIRR
ncbi:MAG TPA: metallophosphoesterase family protein, partial [Longimicrobiaceae bacterium]|nr:metallophosphoesterase family protein [Longimicrobiaceae bacterium]